MAIPPIYETPGTNFHDLNLDWLISQMQDMSAGWAEMREDWQEEQVKIDLIPEKINQYFEEEGIPTIFTDAIAAAVAAETGDREAADTTLQGNISSEATARASADSDLGQRITNETTAREAADTTLQGNIDTLAGRVTTNEGAISTLNTGLTDEATARAQMDTELDSRLDSVEAAIVGLQGAVRLDPFTASGAKQGYYPRVYPGTMLDLENITQQSAWRSAVYDAEPYEIFSLSWMPVGSATDAVTFLDANNVVLARTNASYSGNIRLGKYLIAPPNTAKVIVQVNSQSRATRYAYRGMLSPYARLMFGGGAVPDAQTATALEFRYVRDDYTNTTQNINYPFETFQWVQPANRGGDDTRALQKTSVEDESMIEEEEQTKTQK